MRSRLDMARFVLDWAYRTLQDNVRNLTLEEALFVPGGGYRSILGTLKHIAGWSHVYRSFAFDEDPQHWDDLDWPHGLRDTVVKSEAYIGDVIHWFDESHTQWQACLGQLGEGQIEELRPTHWGERLPVFDILVLIAMLTYITLARSTSSCPSAGARPGKRAKKSKRTTSQPWGTG